MAPGPVFSFSQNLIENPGNIRIRHLYIQIIPGNPLCHGFWNVVHRGLQNSEAAEKTAEGLDGRFHHIRIWKK